VDGFLGAPRAIPTHMLVTFIKECYMAGLSVTLLTRADAVIE
jgi:hypothetical protein